MLLDSNFLIYGASGEFPALDEVLDRTDLAAASVTRIETLGYHQLSEVERHWLEAAFASMRILQLDDAVASRAIAIRQERRMALADAISPPRHSFTRCPWSRATRTTSNTSPAWN